MDFAELSRLAGGHAEARAIQVALKMGLFEALANGPLNAAEVAHTIGTERRTAPPAARESR